MCAIYDTALKIVDSYKRQRESSFFDLKNRWPVQTKSAFPSGRFQKIVKDNKLLGGSLGSQSAGIAPLHNFLILLTPPPPPLDCNHKQGRCKENGCYACKQCGSCGHSNSPGKLPKRKSIRGIHLEEKLNSLQERIQPGELRVSFFISTMKSPVSKFLPIK